jgi:proteasome accessory factor C
MAKSTTTPLEQTARMLDLVPFLLSHQGISLGDLAKHFKVENDVMLDDLNTLWMCGLPGYTPLELIDLTFDSGYVTIRNAAPLAYVRTMSSSEIVSLALGLDLLLESADRFGEEQSGRIRNLSNRLRTEIGEHISIVSNSQTAHRSLVATSIAQRLPIEMTYFSASSDTKTERTVTAYDFFNDNDVEYFQAYCHSAKSMRTFRVDRIVSAVLSGVAQDLPSSQGQNNERIRVGATIKVLDRSSAEAFALTYSELREGAHVTLEAFSPEWLIRAIMGGAGSITVDEPEEIRVQLRQSLEATIALYE